MLDGYNVSLEKILVQEDPGMYHFINQGCLTVDGMDDPEEMKITDVCICRVLSQQSSCVCGYFPPIQLSLFLF